MEEVIDVDVEPEPEGDLPAIWLYNCFNEDGFGGLALASAVAVARGRCSKFVTKLLW